ncbi:MAG: Cna B-type domain-containing protein [Lachnospiraceae bacterium]
MSKFQNWLEEKINRGLVRRRLAALLACSLICTQMGASLVAADTSDDLIRDQQEWVVTHGSITIMDDDTSSQLLNARDLKLGVWVDGEYNPDLEVYIDETGTSYASGSDWVPIINDLGDNADGSGVLNNQGFRLWTYYVLGIADDEDHTYSIRELSYHPATSSNATQGNATRRNVTENYALFYADGSGAVIDKTGEEWDDTAQNLVYVRRTTISGDLINNTDVSLEDLVLTLTAGIVESEDNDYDDYIEMASTSIDETTGKWFIENAIRFDPETGDVLTWRIQADISELPEGVGIGYGSEEDSEEEAYAYENGIITLYNNICTVTGTIIWTDNDDEYQKRPDINELELEIRDSDGNLLTQEDTGIEIEIQSSKEDGQWIYTVSGLHSGSDYYITAAIPDGYTVSPSQEVAFTAEQDLEIEAIAFIASDPLMLTITNTVLGISGNQEVNAQYTIYTDDGSGSVPYQGRYVITTSSGISESGVIDENNPYITVAAGETVSIALIDADGDAVVTVEQTLPENSGAIFLHDDSDGSNQFTFWNSILTEEQLSIYWNDNNNSEGTRPYDSEDEYLDSDKIHLYFSLQYEDGTPYGDSDGYLLEDWFAMLGLDGWDTASGMDVIGGSVGWNYTADGLPAYTVLDDGTLLKITYWFDVDDVDGYLTTRPEAANDSGIWEFTYTVETSLDFTVQWLDDDGKNNTRPDTDTDSWKESLELYCVSTNPKNDGAQPESISIDLDAVVVTDSGDIWEVSIQGLPEYDEDGYPYIYYIVQNDVAVADDATVINDVEDISYVTEYDNTGNYNIETGAVYQGGVITNTLTGTTTFQATKIWRDGSLASGSDSRPTVTIELWRYVKGQSYNEASKVSVTVPLTYNESTGNYDINITDLPVFDKDGQEYVYYVRESMSGTTASKYTCIIENVEDGAFKDQNGYDKLIFNDGILTNKLDGIVHVEGTKVWNAKEIQGAEISITVELQRRLKPETTSSRSIEDLLVMGRELLRAEEEWTTIETKTEPGLEHGIMTQQFDFGDYPQYDDDGYEYEYRVVETSVTIKIGDDTVTINLPADQSDASVEFEVNGEVYVLERHTEDDGTIVNTLSGKTVVEIIKHWRADPEDTEELHFHLYRNGVDICKEYSEIYGLDYTENGGSHDGCLVMTEADWSGTPESDDEATGYILSGLLDKYDDEGREYIYTVSETVPAGYYCNIDNWYGEGSHDVGYDHYGADIYNGKGPGYQISVAKKWLDDGESLHREEVTVVIQDKDPDSNEEYTITLNKGNVWSGRVGLLKTPDNYVVRETAIGVYDRGAFADSVEWSRIADYYENGDDNAKANYIQTGQYYYHVEENITYEGESEYIWEITNRRVGTIDINVKKDWIIGALTPSAVTFTFAAEGHDDVTIEVSSDTDWKESEIALPKYNENGVMYQWYLKDEQFSVTDENGIEQSIKSYSNVEVEWGPNQNTNDQYNYEVTNKIVGTTAVLFHKIWKDNNGADGVSRPDIYYKLYRTVDSDGDGMLSEAEKQAAVYLDALDYRPIWEQIDEYHWICSYGNLSAYDGDGYAYIYFAEEGMAAPTSGDWQKAYYEVLPAGIDDYDRTIPLEKADDVDCIPVDGITVNYREAVTTATGRKIWKNMGSLNSSDYPEIELSLWYAVMDENGVYGTSMPVLDDAGEQLTVVLPDSTGSYKFSFEGLPKYELETGSRIQYRLSETPVGDGEIGGFEWLKDYRSFELVNTYDGSGEMSIKLTKEWDWGDLSDEVEIKYPTVTFTLYRKIQGMVNDSYVDLNYPEEKVGVVTLDISQGYVEFTELPYFAPNGRPYRYYVIENTINGYQNGYQASTIDLGELATGSDANEVTVTNTYTEETVTIKGTKTWQGDTGWDTKPEDITLTLYRYPGSNTGAAEVVEAELVWTKNASGMTWTYVFKETTQPFYRYATNGQMFTYYVMEDADSAPAYETPDGKITGSGAGSTDSYTWTINMTNKLKTTELEAVKKWEDNDNSYGTRPTEITVELQRKLAGQEDSEYKQVFEPGTEDVWQKTISGDDGWRISFTGLPKYEVVDKENGPEAVAYQYRAVEVNPDGGYESTQETEGGTTTITNTLKSGNITVTKRWSDSNDQDGIRPQEVKVQLFATTTGKTDDGIPVMADGAEAVVTLSEANGWTDGWQGLPTHNSDGEEYKYFVVELPDTSTGETLSWYTVGYSTDFTDDVLGEPLEQNILVIPETDGKNIYITNSYVPKTMTITVEKQWVGEDGETEITNAEAKPESITYVLQSKFEGDSDDAWINVTVATPSTAQTVTADDQYSATWTEVPVKGLDGSDSRVIEYRVVEERPSGYEVLSYTYSVDGESKENCVSGDITPGTGNDAHITVTNRLTARTSVSVVKKWVEPESEWITYDRTAIIETIVFELQYKGSDGFVAVDEREVPVTGDDEIEVSFDDLPRYDSYGNEIEYRIVEKSFLLTDGTVILAVADADQQNGTIGNYEFTAVTEKPSTPVADTASGSNTVITNTLPTTELTVEKIWDDQSDYYNTRPGKITVQLEYSADGTDWQPVTGAYQELDIANGISKVTFNNLPAYLYDAASNSFVKYNYRAVETGMDQASVIDDTALGYEVSYHYTANTETQDAKSEITNKLAVTSITGTKTWIDQSDRYGLRPDEITLIVQANGTDMAVQPKIEWTRTDGSNRWSWKAEGLPLTDQDGVEITYTVREEGMSGYDAEYSEEGLDITNRQRTGSLAVTKIRVGGSDRSFTFYVTLIINGQEQVYTGAYKVLGADEDPDTASDVRMTDESGAISINGGQKFYITDLPEGISFVVTEANSTGFRLTSMTGDIGVIVSDAIQEASFTNTYSGGGGSGGGGGSSSGSGGSGSSTSDPTATIDDDQTPLGQLLDFIEDAVPLAGLVRTGDFGIPVLLLGAIMIMAAAGFGTVSYRRKKRNK